jgi:hypothetical protein
MKHLLGDKSSVTVPSDFFLLILFSKGRVANLLKCCYYSNKVGNSLNIYLHLKTFYLRSAKASIDAKETIGLKVEKFSIVDNFLLL